ncbi:MAG: hypothetical protein IJP04_06035 [Clostridia bacterium]|nr:hypothetical protein [Clostridia bacterium]
MEQKGIKRFPTDFQQIVVTPPVLPALLQAIKFTLYAYGKEAEKVILESIKNTFIQFVDQNTEKEYL